MIQDARGSAFVLFRDSFEDCNTAQLAIVPRDSTRPRVGEISVIVICQSHLILQRKRSWATTVGVLDWSKGHMPDHFKR